MDVPTSAVLIALSTSSIIRIEAGTVSRTSLVAGAGDDIPTHAGIQVITHYVYRPDGNISEKYEFFGSGPVRQHVIYRYSEDGKWLKGDIYDEKGKHVGSEMTKPEVFVAPELLALWRYELQELAAFGVSPAEPLLSGLPAWDGVPRLQAWLEASLGRAPQPTLPSQSPTQSAKSKVAGWLRRLFAGDRS